DDRLALGSALEGCSGFFVLLPFDLTADDLDAHADRLISSIVGAVADQDVPHVVMLSSGGADLDTRTRTITPLHRMEQATLTTRTIPTALRSCYFQENITDVIDVVRYCGVYPMFATSANTPLTWLAPPEIREDKARALLSQ